jgi:hypothetical protein
MRVASLPKRLLGLGAARVTGAEVLGRGGAQILEVTLARRSNGRMFCSRCGRRCTGIYDRQMRSWRHLDAVRASRPAVCEHLVRGLQDPQTVALRV